MKKYIVLVHVELTRPITDAEKLDIRDRLHKALYELPDLRVASQMEVDEL